MGYCHIYQYKKFLALKNKKQSRFGLCFLFLLSFKFNLLLSHSGILVLLKLQGSLKLANF